MAGTGNLLFDVSSEVGEEIFRARKEALNTKAIECGMKQGSAKEWRTAVETNEKFRADELKRLGVKDILTQWGGDKNG